MSGDFYAHLRIFMGLVLLALITRLIPHPPNFAPMTSIALLSGYYFNRKPVAVMMPLAAMFISDYFIGFHGLMPVVYLSLVLTTALGSMVSRITIWNILLGSLIFFLITNFGVWLNGYPKTWEGLVLCYTLAIPFFMNSILGDLFYTCVILVILKMMQGRILAKHGGYLLNC